MAVVIAKELLGGQANHSLPGLHTYGFTPNCQNKNKLKGGPTALLITGWRLFRYSVDIELSIIVEGVLVRGSDKNHPIGDSRYGKFCRDTRKSRQARAVSVWAGKAAVKHRRTNVCSIECIENG